MYNNIYIYTHVHTHNIHVHVIPCQHISIWWLIHQEPSQYAKLFPEESQWPHKHKFLLPTARTEVTKCQVMTWVVTTLISFFFCLTINDYILPCYTMPLLVINVHFWVLFVPPCSTLFHAQAKQLNPRRWWSVVFGTANETGQSFLRL